MTIRVALHHRTSYRFDRPVKVSPHEIRLRPAPHCRTPVLGYSLNVEPAQNFLNWQQDPYGNWVARSSFPSRPTSLDITVDLVADMTVVNPFDFFVEPYAEFYPFEYAHALAKELIPFLDAAPAGPRLAAWLDAFRATLRADEKTVDMLVRLNQPAAARDPLSRPHGARRADARGNLRVGRKARAATRAGCWSRSCVISALRRGSRRAT